MKISKKVILEGLIILRYTYTEFDKRMQDENNGKEILKIWQEIFEEIDFDYQEANEDFIKSIKLNVTKNKYVPTISEIIEEMKKINNKRIKKRNEEQLWNMLIIEEKCNLKNNNIDKALKQYCYLIKKYNNKQIKEMIDNFKKINSISENMILPTEDILERIMK